MTILEDVKIMQRQGISETEIISALQNKGVPYREISDALSQSKIKAAIEQSIDLEAPTANPYAPRYSSENDYSQESEQHESSQEELAMSASYPQQNNNNYSQNEAMPGMQASIMQTGFQESPSSQEYSSQSYQQPQQEYVPSPGDYSQYPQANGGNNMNQQQYEYQPYEYSQVGGVSSDTISEIAEQIVSEKMSETRKQISKALDFKTATEAKLESLHDRLNRIEKIIDTLQSSVLRKVGDYVTNVDDIKRELIETQKSFTRLLPEVRKEVKKTEKTEHRTQSSSGASSNIHHSTPPHHQVHTHHIQRHSLEHHFTPNHTTHSTTTTHSKKSKKKS